MDNRVGRSPAGHSPAGRSPETGRIADLGADKREQESYSGVDIGCMGPTC